MSPKKVYTRRAFMRSGSSVALLAVPTVRRPLLTAVNSGSAGSILGTSQEIGRPDADTISKLLLRAVDAAKSAGATYADARAVRVINQSLESQRTLLFDADWNIGPFGDQLPTVEEHERHAISVRALVNGVWGFTASPWWTEDEAVTLARNAVAQARDNAQWAASTVDLVPAPVTVGSWTTPLRIDPFTVPIEEKMELLIQAELAYRPLYRALDHAESADFLNLSCQHVMRALATSEGTSTVQHFYSTRLGQRRGESQDNGVHLEGEHTVFGPTYGAQLWFRDFPVPAGTGWETIADRDLWTLGKEAAELAQAASAKEKQARDVEIGTYTIVMDAPTVGRLLDLTIGQAADLDRITGEEANAGGTSYLGSDPLQLLGSDSFGSPLLNVTTTRASQVGNVNGLPGARWDDEGVPHTPITFVKDGVLHDVPTTRDRVSQVASYYTKRGMPLASNGCAASGDGFGLDIPTVNPPTLVLHPGPENVSLTEMIASVPRGLVLTNAEIQTDSQYRQLILTPGWNGVSQGGGQEIVNGRLGKFIRNIAVVVDTKQLWKSLTVLGGQGTAAFVEGSWHKGIPPQTLPTGAVAVPAVFREMSVVNRSRL